MCTRRCWRPGRRSACSRSPWPSNAPATPHGRRSATPPTGSRSSRPRGNGPTPRQRSPRWPTESTGTCCAPLHAGLDAWFARHLQPGDTAYDVERPVSGYLLDPGPAPDLSTFDSSPDDAYEWLLSDHPWARAERVRRAESGWDAELRNAGAVRDWTDRIDGADLRERYPHDPEIAENLRGLAEIMRPLADTQQLNAHRDSAVPDAVRVHRLREQWATRQHIQGDQGYRYPARLLGPGAAAHPPPTSGSASKARR
ncbi:hypothetical protein [Amycolatopsis rubida]|uniref:Uncharacterized protein n=1 Tax=Amycolatopsis rubida TaxID=112413 RepID=A0A1I6BM27_9PSEU|nr:hypothetical protein [Amycolatopsis rubida]SFQ81992.1 hypothetical protein SAMN05421854_13210 [Amycolatopsis rubida]